MIELERADPASGVEPDGLRLRAKVDERIGLYPPLVSGPRRVAAPGSSPWPRWQWWQ